MNIPIDHVSNNQLDTLLRHWLKGYKKRLIVTPNAEMLLAAVNDTRLEAALNESHLALPDAAALRFAVSAKYGSGIFKYRHTGTDTLQKLAKIASEEGRKIMLVGGGIDSAKLATQVLQKRHPNLLITFLDPGKIEYQEGKVFIPEKIIKEINEWAPDILALGLGHGKQEVALATHLHLFSSVKIGIGIGGAFDMINGSLKRAPKIWRESGFEWLWRLLLEPSRIGRIYTATVVFPLHVAYDAFRNRRFLFAVRHVLPEVLNQIRGK